MSLLKSLSPLICKAKKLVTDDLALAYLEERHDELFREARINLNLLQTTHTGQTTSVAATAIRLAATLTPMPLSVEGTLSPIFQQVKLTGGDAAAVSYSLRNFCEGVAYAKSDTILRPNAYAELVNSLEQRLRDLAKLRPDQPALLANLLEFLREVTWCIPVLEAGVSLYDQARLCAAIAVVFGIQAATQKNIEQEGEPLFVLAVGDVSGIQAHIYRIRSTSTGTGALAKRLRARSLEVALSAEAMARDILTTLQLPITQRIMGAGGKFYLLLPEGSATTDALSNVRNEWEQHSLEQGATLIPHIVWESFTSRDFDRFKTVVQRVHRRLASAKLQPLSSQVASPFLFGGGQTEPCAAYGFVPASAGSHVSKQAERDRAIGTRLPRVQALTFTVAAPSTDPPICLPKSNVQLGQADGETLRNTFDFTPAPTTWEVRPLLGHLPTVRDALEATTYDLATYEAWLADKGVESRDDSDGQSRISEHDPLTFGALAALSEGVPLLGALMLDADRMGEAFTKGLPDAGISQVAALSRMVETFFAAEVATLIRSPKTYSEILGYNEADRWKTAAYPLIYSVYAGGDDLFLLGPWHALLHFAQDLNLLFQRYTVQPDFSLSGGFALVRPKLPVVQVSEQLQDLERQAKAANQNALRNMQPTGHLALFGQVVPWAELTELGAWKTKLVNDLESDTVSRAQCYRWLKLFNQFQKTDDPALAMRYKPLLRYALRPQGESSRELYHEYQDLLNHTHPAWRYLGVWVQWALYSLRES